MWLFSNIDKLRNAEHFFVAQDELGWKFGDIVSHISKQQRRAFWAISSVVFFFCM